MKKIRTGVFETNSSSVHSLVFYDMGVLGTAEKELESLIAWDGKIHITPDDFGWEYSGPYYGAIKKLSYIATTIVQKCREYDENWNETVDTEELENDSEFLEVDDILCKNINGCKGWVIDPKNDYYPWGYVDHQSYLGNIKNFLSYEGVSLYEFIFDDKVELVIYNDNH